jgi:hypothetical protein
LRSRVYLRTERVAADRRHRRPRLPEESHGHRHTSRLSLRHSDHLHDRHDHDHEHYDLDDNLNNDLNGNKRDWGGG